MWNIFICIWLVKLYYLFGRLNYFACYFISQYVWIQINVKLGGQPATPAHMDRRVGRAADPYKKQDEGRTGGRPKQTKNERNRRSFESTRWSCSSTDGSPNGAHYPVYQIKFEMPFDAFVYLSCTFPSPNLVLLVCWLLEGQPTYLTSSHLIWHLH